MKQDLEQFDNMVEYCEQDVWLLEAVYLKLRAWHKNHPSLVEGDVCTACGSDKIVLNGTYLTPSGVYQRYCCSICRKGMRGRQRLKRRHTLANI